MGKTLFEKVWDAHVVSQDPGAPAVLYIDAHLIHEVTSPQAFGPVTQFSGLRLELLLESRAPRSAYFIYIKQGPLAQLVRAADS